MHNTGIDSDILIVGAGPVGLFLANECARRGLSWRLIEGQASQSAHSKALAIFTRTMEIFDMAGVVGPFLEKANRVTTVVMISNGRPLAHMRFAPEETPYSFVAMVPQNITEEILAEELRRKGGRVEYNTAFVSAEQQGDSVTANVRRNGESQQLRARFVVGCDGAHSEVRHAMNLSLEGGEYPETFMLADVETDTTLRADEMQLCPSELGPLAIFPMNASRRRIVATVDRTEGDAPSLELVRQIVAERAPHGIQLRALHWSSYFRIHHRHATALRVGRVFIAGDAAHIHSPFGGQGMNTGLQDVWNLVWKLDFVLRGQGNEQLLASYSEERLPIIKQVIDTTDHLTKVMGSPSRLVQVLRDTLIPMVSRLAPFQHAFVQRLSELGIAYRGSPIVEGPGKRYFDETVRGGNGIRSHFLLLIGENEQPAVKDGAKQLCESLRNAVEPRSAPQRGITLIRPDGYEAYSSQDSDGISALAEVRSVLERQTQPSNAQAIHDAAHSAAK
jgi:2-polyprenyl-6-methoxyphenol hydroxylase-like FAD-dependent oxidoreductase